MKWLTNATEKDARANVWCRDRIIGRPKATDKYTVEELEAMGIVGVYAPPDKEDVT